MALTAPRTRTASPERWVRAAERARTEGIRVYQVSSTGQWIASSGSDAYTAYELNVWPGGHVTCTCQAAQHGDMVCKHRAAYHLAMGTLPFQAEVNEPAMTGCRRCFGQDSHWAGSVNDATNPTRRITCPDCAGTGHVAA